ncbi:Myblike DNAbinding domain-containing protein [Rhizophlyctis rosea]|nr:Myblike DNAbinding domain-containing protein [Rhizophlyctis rosea]
MHPPRTLFCRQFHITTPTAATKHTGRPWTSEEDISITEFAAEAKQKDEHPKWKVLAEKLDRTHHAIEFRWEYHLDPSIKRTPYTEEENTYIRAAATLTPNNIDWRAIAKKLNRHPKSVKLHYESKLQHPYIKGPFSEQEDIIIRREGVSALEDSRKPDWHKISKTLIRPSPVIARRWATILDPHVKRGPWTPEEDAFITAVVKRSTDASEPVDWPEVGRALKRSGISCRSHYVNHLRGEVLENRGKEFTVEEDEILRRLKGEGKGYKAIAVEMNRSRNAVTRRWNRLFKREQGGEVEEEEEDGEEGVGDFLVGKEKGKTGDSDNARGKNEKVLVEEEKVASSAEEKAKTAGEGAKVAVESIDSNGSTQYNQTTGEAIDVADDIGGDAKEGRGRKSTHSKEYAGEGGEVITEEELERMAWLESDGSGAGGSSRGRRGRKGRQ